MKKRYRKLYYTIIIINIIFLLLFLLIAMFYYKKINNELMYNKNILSNYTKESTLQKNNINVLKNELNTLKDEINNIHTSINSVKIIKDTYNNDISLLNAKINNIINTKPEEEKLKYTIIKTLNTILKKYYNGESFIEELNSLKILCKHDEKLILNIDKLDLYKDININSIILSFESEIKNLVFDKKSTILKDLIKIKKISDKKTTKSINTNINNIKNNINTYKFEKSITLIDEYDYRDKLHNTYNLLNFNVEFINLLKKISNTI